LSTSGEAALHNFPQNVGGIAYNVKVVYDVSGVAIRELRSSFSNSKNVAERKPHKGRKPDCGFSEPEPL
jgi:hypothetical protein